MHYLDWLYLLPRSALLTFACTSAGPMVGAPFAPPAPVPPAVIPAFFHNVCETKTVINPSEVNGQIPDASAATLVQAWVDKLNQVDNRCVEIEAKTQQIFDFWSVTSIVIPLSASALTQNNTHPGSLAIRNGCLTFGPRSPSRPS